MKASPVEGLLDRIRLAMETIDRPVRLMEVCGTHTQAVERHGLRTIFPTGLEMVSGPGCPVCVTPQHEIERMILLARSPGLTICTFGDMMRVPGIHSSLERERAEGADVRVVYSPRDALSLAERDPERDVVFLAVGFETTAPTVASIVLEALRQDVANFSVFVSHKLIPPAMEAVLEGTGRLDGFLTPGHVSVVIGARAYEDLAQRHAIPCVATGFEPHDVIEGVAMLVEHVAEGRAGSFIQYRRAVEVEGNRLAREIMHKAFEPVDSDWRGLGTIPQSGLRLREELRDLDAVRRFSVPEVEPVEVPGCRCGEILKGLVSPCDCPLFGGACTPETPVGPCMVSSEGSCSVRFKYG
jgi:hydrogenase expression/formation protein HypD